MDFQTRYEFDPKKDLLGKGGFSKVYKANDILLERTVALKFFTAKTADKYQILNEIKKVIRFEHPNLCKYYDVALLNYKNVLDETEQMEVGIMEYIDAGDFKSYLKKNPQYIDKLLIDVLKGLAYLHKHGMAHRDLKPQNILIKIVDDEPVGKITDFGISKLIDSDDANSSALLGTIEYMAPEQFNPKKYGINGRITTNLDLWSFGLLVYESFCHVSLFGSRSSGINAEQVMSNILSDAPLEKLEGLPAKYREIISRCLVKNATERVQNALELIPLFQDGETTMAPISVYSQTDSGKILITETEILTPPQPITGDVTQAIFPLQEEEVLATKVFDLEVISNDELQPVNAEAGDTLNDTQLIEPVSSTSEITQIWPKVSAPANDDMHLIEVSSEAAETDTQVISRSPIPPPIKEDNFDSLWTKNLKQNGKRTVAKKGVKKGIVLTSVAVLLIAVFVIFAVLQSSPDASPPIAKPAIKPAPSPKPIPPAFTPPNTLSVVGGTFLMGRESNVQPVTLSDFAIGEKEITIEQFRRFIEDAGYITTAEQKKSSQVFANGRWSLKDSVNWRHNVQGILIDTAQKNLPVVHVSWIDAVEYCKWLSKKTGKGYRLLTEAEWEYAARGGSNSKQYLFSGSNNADEVAWFDGNSGGIIHNVAEKKPNELGIYDMSGNAMEWCADLYDKNYFKKAPPQNPVNNESGNQRVTRGGAAGAYKQYCSNFFRYHFDDDETGGNLGFRICRVAK